MHGVIFSSLREFVGEVYGAEVARDLFRGEPLYFMTEAYPDEQLLELIGRAVETTGADADELVFEFGAFTVQNTFARLYRAFFEISPDARSFMLPLEQRIHALVRSTLPNAKPPQLKISEHGADGVRIVYSSPRRLCVLLRGLATGAARYYGETLEIEEPRCMLRGDEACTFELRFSPAPAA